MAISTIPAVSTPISVELSPIPVTSRSLRWSAAVRSLMRRFRSLRDSLSIENMVKHRKTSSNTCKTLWYFVKHRKTLWNITKHLMLWNITKHLMSPRFAQRHLRSAQWYRRSVQRHRRSRRVSCDIGNYGVGKTPQMCNRVTNHGDMGTF